MSQHEKPSQGENHVLEEADLRTQLDAVEAEKKRWDDKLNTLEAERKSLTKNALSYVLHSKRLNEIVTAKGPIIDMINNLVFRKRELDSLLRNVRKHGKVKTVTAV